MHLPTATKNGWLVHTAVGGQKQRNRPHNVSLQGHPGFSGISSTGIPAIGHYRMSRSLSRFSTIFQSEPSKKTVRVFRAADFSMKVLIQQSWVRSIECL
jgi:hypothetical protein